MTDSFDVFSQSQSVLTSTTPTHCFTVFHKNITKKLQRVHIAFGHVISLTKQTSSSRNMLHWFHVQYRITYILVVILFNIQFTLTVSLDISSKCITRPASALRTTGIGLSRHVHVILATIFCKHFCRLCNVLQ